MVGVPQNIELKVECSAEDFASIRARLAERSLSSLTTVWQTDLYFQAASGRLKLRTINENGDTAVELIQYHRRDQQGARLSTYGRIPISAESGSEIERALSEALGVLVCVRKQRTVALWRSTRIHLDEVDGLGSFIELETMLSDSLSAEAGQAEYEDVVNWLGLARLNSVPGSYSDLVLKKGDDS